MSKPAPIHIGVVDDDPSQCQALGRLLRAAGYEARAYHSAEAFLADSARPAFECVLLDIQLEGMSGFELQEELAAGDAKTPVIFITAHDGPEAGERAERAGCAYLRKTDPGSTVLRAILEVLRRS